MILLIHPKMQKHLRSSKSTPLDKNALSLLTSLPGHNEQLIISSKGKFCFQLYRKQDKATCIHKNLFYMVYLDHFWAQTEQT